MEDQLYSFFRAMGWESWTGVVIAVYPILVLAASALDAAVKDYDTWWSKAISVIAWNIGKAKNDPEAQLDPVVE